MIDPESWHWPQYLYLTLAFSGLVAHAMRHGTPTNLYWNFPVRACIFALSLFILAFGGFFGDRL